MLDGVGYRYFYSAISMAWRTERCVELPVVKALVEATAPDDVLEVGDVLHQYYGFRHTVVDKYERRPGVVSEDITSYNPDRNFKLIVCISTLEHVGYDESPRDDGKALDAIACMKRLLKPGGVLFATVPVGWHPRLDEGLDSQRSLFEKILFMRRVGYDRWVECGRDGLDGVRFHRPYPAANGLRLCFWTRRG